ncbi:MAG: hypothetical protein DME22_16140 [Verrucomicrobia bacterium]|nr:MAG: hypothetical protein DME22_16140 [Verrucomicrobiota bacterium]PYJ96860.1 MAG: hypothetical protein DME23_18510 [Verrucomicrobiota bacterium]
MKTLTWLQKLIERVAGVVLLGIFAPPLLFLAMAVWFSSGGRVLVTRRITSAAGRLVDVFAFETWSRSGRKLAIGELMDQYSLTDLPMLINLTRGEIGFAELKESFRPNSKPFWPRNLK